MPLTAPEPKAQRIERYARHVSSGKAEFFSRAGLDFMPGRREGIYLYDLDGRRLINCHCNGGVFNLGHRHPRVVAALKQALDDWDIGNHHLLSHPRAVLAERLAAIAPAGLNRVVFAVGGGEAIDLALKLARGATGRPKIISAQGGYHGHTGLALAAGDPQYRAPFEPLAPGFVQVPFGDVDALRAAIDDTTAAVIFETVPATLGIVVPPPGFFAAVRELCTQSGAVMIVDEVQTGLGRCGEIWGIDAFDVAPDILVTGKGLSGGIYPIAATLYHDRLNPFLHAHPFIHISTFGGAEVGCAVALEVLDLLAAPGFLEHVRAMAALFAAGLSELCAGHPALLREVRQLGLMMGLKLADPAYGPLLTLAGFQHGLLAIYANNDPSVVQLLPPLIIRPAEVEQVLAALDPMLAWVEAAVAAGASRNL